MARRVYGPRTCCEATDCPVWGDEYLINDDEEEE